MSTRVLVFPGVSSMQRELAMDLIKNLCILSPPGRKGKYCCLDVCSMCVRFATQQRDTSGLINHQVKYFAKVKSTFTIFLHRRHGRFIVYQFKTVSLFSNRDFKVTKRMPSSSSSSSCVTSPSSTTRLD